MPTRRQVYTGSWYYFENILKPELESQGNVFPGGVKQVAQQFGHKWRDLDPLEKIRIKDLAVEYRRTPECKERLDKTKKFVQPKPLESRKERRDTTGEFLKNRVDFEKIFIERRLQMKEKLLDGWLHKYNGYLNGVIYEKFYFFAFEWYCRCLDQSYLPAEVALAEFSLIDGISRVFHKIIFPVDIPIGMSGTAKIISEQSHKIDPHMGLQSDVDSSDFQELITNNCEEILRSIVDFVGPRVNQSDSDRARFFCYFNHHTGIISCLNYLKQRCQDRSLKDHLKDDQLFCAEDLLECFKRWKLKNISEAETTAAKMNDLLRTSKFDFTPNTRCPYHDHIDNVNCAEATVRRQCYMFVDALRDIYAFDITSAHTPFEISTKTKAAHNVPGPSGSDYGRLRIADARTYSQTSTGLICSETGINEVRSTVLIQPQTGGNTEFPFRPAGRGRGRPVIACEVTLI